MTKFQIRTARLDELSDIGDLLVAAFNEFFPAQYESPGEREAWDLYREEIRDTKSRFENSHQLVAESGRLVGAVSYFGPDRLEYAEMDMDFPSGWAAFRLLGVAPSARGQGLGRALTQACLDAAKDDDANGVLLHTTEPMIVARSMYERFGFQRDKDFDLYPIPDSDFVVMCYRLPLK